MVRASSSGRSTPFSSAARFKAARVSRPVTTRRPSGSFSMFEMMSSMVERMPAASSASSSGSTVPVFLRLSIEFLITASRSAMSMNVSSHPPSSLAGNSLPAILLASTPRKVRPALRFSLLMCTRAIALLCASLNPCPILCRMKRVGEVLICWVTAGASRSAGRPAFW